LDEVLDGVWAGEAVDESFQGTGHPLWVLWCFCEFLPHAGRLDLSEQSLQGGLAIQEDFQVAGVLKIVNQGGVSQHGAQGSAQGLAAGFVAALAFEISKESFHEIVGSLGLDPAAALWGGNDQGGRKQLWAVAFDLIEHLLQGGRARIIGTRPNLLCQGLNFLLEGFRTAIPFPVSSRRSLRGCDTLPGAKAGALRT